MPTQVSINIYRNKDYKMVAHKDGQGDQAAIISLASHTTLDFYHSPADLPITFTEVHSHTVAGVLPSTRILLQPRSLFISSKQAFTDYVHAITTADQDVLDSSTYGNFHLLNRHQADGAVPYADGDRFQRAPRISLVCWP
jgi:hypothetical protein